MLYNEVSQEIFTASADYVLVHCISADFSMSAGVAKAFIETGIKDELLSRYPANKWEGHGYCLPVKINGRIILNLVTKPKAFFKPTYETLEESLNDMKKQLPKHIKLAMPHIGCGFDGLNWTEVSHMIKDTFEDTDIEILVYQYNS